MRHASSRALTIVNGPVQPLRPDAPKGWRVVNKGGQVGEVWVYGTIGDDFWEEGVTAKGFAEALAEIGPVQTLNIYINSGGGSVFQGEAIYNTLRRHRAKKIVHVDGLAASIASVIAMAGDEIHIARNGLIMIHDPSGGCMGGANDMRKMASALDLIKQAIVDTYVLRTGSPAKDVADWMAAETWMNAEEAIARGFADQVAEPVAVAAFAGVNVTNYKHAPDALRAAAAAPAPEPAATTPDQPNDQSQVGSLHPSIARAELRLQKRGLLSGTHPASA